MKSIREEKLHPASQLAHELAEFGEQLRSYGNRYEHIIGWIDATLNRIDRHLNDRIWPPAWWRYGFIDADAHSLVHGLHRMDGEGYFFANTDTGYLPERNEVLSRIDTIYSNYLAARRGAA